MFNNTQYLKAMQKQLKKLDDENHLLENKKKGLTNTLYDNKQFISKLRMKKNKLELKDIKMEDATKEKVKKGKKKIKTRTKKDLIKKFTKTNKRKSDWADYMSNGHFAKLKAIDLEDQSSDEELEILGVPNYDSPEDQSNSSGNSSSDRDDLYNWMATPVKSPISNNLPELTLLQQEEFEDWKLEQIKKVKELEEALKLKRQQEEDELLSDEIL